MNKKRKPPTHIQKPKANHPQPDLRLIGSLETIEDPRGASCNFKHPLTTILFTTIICSLCGADDWETIFLQANAMVDWLGKFVDVSQGIPCVRTFKRIFEALSPQQLEKLLIGTANLWREKKEGDVISFDGKTMRGTSAFRKCFKGDSYVECVEPRQWYLHWSHESG